MHDKVIVTPEEMDPKTHPPLKRRRQRYRKECKTGPLPGGANSRLPDDLSKQEWDEVERLAKMRSPLSEIGARLDINPEKLGRLIERHYGVPHAIWMEGKREYARNYLRERAWEMATDGKHPLLTIVHLFNIMPGEFKDVKQIVHTKSPTDDSTKAVELLTKLFKKISLTQKKNPDLKFDNAQDAEYVECQNPPTMHTETPGPTLYTPPMVCMNNVQSAPDDPTHD